MTVRARRSRNAAMTPRHTRGLALIVAMLVAALTAAVAATLVADESLWSARVLHRGEQVQAQSLARAGVKWARQILAATPGAQAIVTLNDPWAFPLPPTPIEGGSVEGRIVDAQGLLNVVDLALDSNGDRSRADLERLAASLGLPSDAVGRLSGWIEARQPLASRALPKTFIPLVVDELAEVPGVAPSTLAAFAPYLVALPPRTPLNVNTASPALLAASVQGLDRDAADALAASRRLQPFASVGDFRARLPAAASAGDLARFAVGSEYFLVRVEAREGDTLARADALVHRSADGAEIVWQRVD